MAFSLANMFKSKPGIDTAEILMQIDYKEGTKFAEDNGNKIYIDIEELGGFPYLKCVIIGKISANIKRVGCNLSFVFKNDEITLESDNTTVESNQIKKTGLYYTPIDFEISDVEAKRIKSDKVLEIRFTFKKDVYSFKPL